MLEPGFSGAIEVDTAKAILFMPKFPASYAVWMGPILTPEEIKTKYAVDEVFYVDQVWSSFIHIFISTSNSFFHYEITQVFFILFLLSNSWDDGEALIHVRV